MTKLLYHSVVSSTPSGASIHVLIVFLILFKMIIVVCVLWAFFNFYWKGDPEASKYLWTLCWIHWVFLLLFSNCSSVFPVWTCNKAVCFWINLVVSVGVIFTMIFCLDLPCFVFVHSFLCWSPIVWQFTVSSFSHFQSGILSNACPFPGTT